MNRRNTSIIKTKRKSSFYFTRLFNKQMLSRLKKKKKKKKFSLIKMFKIWFVNKSDSESVSSVSIMTSSTIGVISRPSLVQYSVSTDWVWLKLLANVTLGIESRASFNQNVKVTQIKCYIVSRHLNFEVDLIFRMIWEVKLINGKKKSTYVYVELQ